MHGTNIGCRAASKNPEGSPFGENLVIDTDGDGVAELVVVIDEATQDKAVLYMELRSQVASSSLTARQKLLFTTALNQTEVLGGLSTEYRFIAKLERKLLQQHTQKIKRWRDRGRLDRSEFRQLRDTIREIINLTRS
jgi:hypothetical protein